MHVCRKTFLSSLQLIKDRVFSPLAWQNFLKTVGSTCTWECSASLESFEFLFFLSFFFFFLRKKENQTVTLQCFGITEYACNFYSSAQTSLPHLVDITGRDIWGNKPWAGMWNIPQNEFLIGCCIKHFESPSLWKGGLSDFMDLVFSLVRRRGFLLLCLLGVPGWFSEDVWKGLTFASHARDQGGKSHPWRKSDPPLVKNPEH